MNHIQAGRSVPGVNATVAVLTREGGAVEVTSSDFLSLCSAATS